MLLIVPYDPGWPAQYDAIAATLRAALGDLALRIDHIGSTAVAGLPAKDVIDVQVTVRALDDAVRDRLVAAGYVWRAQADADHVPAGAADAPEAWRKLLFVAPGAQRRAHVHVRMQGAPNQRYALLFRDFLRADAPTAAAYAELKRRLARSLADPADYPEVKDPAVDIVYRAAEAWARASGWSPG